MNYEAATREDVAAWVRQHGVDSTVDSKTRSSSSAGAGQETPQPGEGLGIVPLTEERWRAEMLAQTREQTRYLRSFWLVLLIFLVLNFIASTVALLM